MTDASRGKKRGGVAAGERATPSVQWASFLRRQNGGIDPACREAIIDILTDARCLAPRSAEATAWQTMEAAIPNAPHAGPSAPEAGPSAPEAGPSTREQQDIYVQGVIDRLDPNNDGGLHHCNVASDTIENGLRLRQIIADQTEDASGELLALVDARLADLEAAGDQHGSKSTLRCRFCGQDSLRTRTEQKRAADEGATEIRWCSNPACTMSA